MNTKAYNMFITTQIWNDFSTYLFIDVKLSTNKSNVQSIKSRFKILTKYFRNIPFNRENFNKYIQEMQEHGYSKNYMNNYIKLAKHLDKYIKLNQLTDYTYFKRNSQHLVDIFTPDEIKAISDTVVPYKRFQEVLNYRYRCLFYFLGMTGCRVGELINLKWSDYFDDYVIFRETKNGEERVVPLSSFLSKLINGLPRDGLTVFEVTHPSTINADLKRRCDMNSIVKQQLSCHIFRHSFITTMLKQNNASVIQVARIVGHKSVESTNLYSHMLIEDLRYTLSYHPLCREEESIEALSTKLRNVIEGLVDRKRFAINVKETAKTLSLDLILL